jgi:hypothetical protein
LDVDADWATLVPTKEKEVEILLERRGKMESFRGRVVHHRGATLGIEFSSPLDDLAGFPL